MSARAAIQVAMAWLACLHATAPARAAFELGDPSPAALGSASTDGARFPFVGHAEGDTEGAWRFGGCRATIFGSDGPVASRLDFGAHDDAHAVQVAWTTISGAGARESAARVEISETTGRSAPAVSLGATAERLDFTYEGFPSWGGWTLGGFACASVEPAGRTIRAWARGERLFRTSALARAAVAPSIAIGASLLAGGSTLSVLDRWEGDAAHSPRVMLELPLGEAARIRFARGAAPGRIGAALLLRVGRMEIGWGRLDYALGGTITSVRVGLVGSKTPARAKAARAKAARAKAARAKAATLSAPNRSAIMRSSAGIAAIDGSDGVPDGAPKGDAAGSLEEAADAAGSDSSDTGRRVEAGWLPAPEDEMESLEPLAEESPSNREIFLRGAVSGERFRMRRIAATDRGRSTRWEAGALEDRGRWRPGAVVTLGTVGSGRARGGAGAWRLEAAAGRVSVAHAPTLFAESMRWARAVSRISAPRAGAPDVAPSRGSTPAALDGVALMAGSSARGGLSGWAVAGRRAGGEDRVLGLGLGIAPGKSRLALSLGVRAQNGDAADGGTTEGGMRRAASYSASVTAVRRGSGGETSAEVLAARDRRSVLLAVERRSRPTVLSARWRYRSWTARRVAAEVSASTPGAASRARLLWRTWAEDAPGDDGVLEAEAVAARRGLGSVRIRAGARGLVGAGAGTDIVSRERYVVLEATVARSRSRSLSFRTSRRVFSGVRSRSSGQTVGVRLDAGSAVIGDHTILVEATRLLSGASTAWGSGLNASGAETLRARSRGGLWLTARGTIGGRRWRIGYALERADEPRGARPWSGTVWLRMGRLP